MDRISNLEVKLAFLENNIFELDGVVRELAESILRLQREIGFLRDQLTPEERNGLEIEKPPHY